MLDHTDTTIGKINFAQAFVGLDGFNIYLSGPMVLLNTFTSFILGLIFIVDYLRSSKKIWNKGELLLPEVNEAKNLRVNQKSEEDDYSEKLAINGSLAHQLGLLKIRNNVFFIFFFGIVYMTAVIRCFFVRDNFINLTEGNERYILDATIYTLMMFSVIPMMY